MDAEKIIKTSFGSKPKLGLEVIDIYKKESLQKFVEDPTTPGGVKLVNEVYPELKADKAMEIINDPKTKEYLDKAGIELKELINKTKGILPAGVDLSGLLGDFSLPECFQFSTSLKNSISMPEWLKIDGSTMKSIFSYAKGLYKEYNIDGLMDNDMVAWGMAQASSLGKSIKAGAGGVGDFVMSAAHKYGVSEKLIGLKDMGKDVVKWITDDASIPDSIKNNMLVDIAVKAAKDGDTDFFKDIYDSAKGFFTAKDRVDTIRGLLSGYVLPPGIKPAGYAAESTAFLGKLNDIDMAWSTTHRNGVVVDNLYNLTLASLDAVFILGFNDTTRAESAVMQSFRPKMETYQKVAKDNYPYLVL